MVFICNGGVYCTCLLIMQLFVESEMFAHHLLCRYEKSQIFFVATADALHSSARASVSLL